MMTCSAKPIPLLAVFDRLSLRGPNLLSAVLHLIGAHLVLTPYVDPTC